jgi:hypothetical protein
VGIRARRETLPALWDENPGTENWIGCAAHVLVSKMSGETAEMKGALLLALTVGLAGQDQSPRPQELLQADRLLRPNEMATVLKASTSMPRNHGIYGPAATQL